MLTRSRLQSTLMAVAALAACGTPAKTPAERPNAGGPAPADGSAQPSTNATGANAAGPKDISEARAPLKQLHDGCFRSCVSQHGTEGPCSTLCTCVVDGLKEEPAAMQELSKARSETPPSPALREAIVKVAARCGETVELPGAAYDPKALRALLRTKVNVKTDHTPAVTPPPKLFEKVTYSAPLGANVAYVSPVKKGKPQPALLWLAGGFDWGIGDSFWLPAPRSNDQSARAFRDAGLALMLPALRGSNENPGHNECFFGEVEDVLAAAEFLAQRPDVDPARIYLGGHSTGATLALLSAQSTQRFRAVFAFGPVADPRQYGESGCVPDGLSDVELKVRAPITGMKLLTAPTFIIEGLEQGNAATFPDLLKVAPHTVQFVEVPGATHFSVLSPGSEVVARAILADTGKVPLLAISVQDITAALARAK